MTAAATIAAKIFHPKCRPRVIQALPTMPHPIGKQAYMTAAGRASSVNSHGDMAMTAPQSAHVAVLNCQIMPTSAFA